MTQTQDISTIFKAEYRNLVAILCRFYGIENVQLAEDLISETFLQALKSWSHNGVPDQPKAWLRKVALNKLKDHHRRNKVYQEKVVPQVSSNEMWIDTNTISEEIIKDSQLNMIFAVCHADLKLEEQICLALRLLCGFNIESIAVALISKKDTINKKLYRAKQKLKEYKEDWRVLKSDDYISRLDSVLRIIYLIFNEGYYSSISDEDIKQELCWEAMRLCIFLSEQTILPKPKIQALIALMCFHASRLESRRGLDGQSILYDKQDRSKWNQELIEKGKKYLSLSAEGKIVSKYHLEGSIAYWHTTDKPNKWENILQLYNKLLIIEYSPIIAMNRTYALAHANSVEEAIQEAMKLKLEGNHLYYSLLAELHKMANKPKEEIKYLELALLHAKKDNEVNLLNQKISILNTQI